jgi:type I restriction enzyme S subunit
MKKYQSYKLEPELWIGEIPIHWNRSRVGRHFKIERGRVISKEEIQENLGEYPVYSSQTSNNGELGKISTYDFDGEYVTWTTDGEKTGTCFYRTGKFNTTNVCGMLSLRETTPYSLKFLNYYLNQVTRPYVRLDINPKLMNNMMSEIPLIIPPLEEQIQIVQFLDEKTEVIDKLISTKERKISLLKEQRTSLINEVITKGLNPNVKIKDSGVEWIGEIPENWEIIPLKILGSFQNGISKGSEFFGHGLPFMNYGDVYKNQVTPLNVEGKVDSTDSERNQYSVLRGDVFFTRTSESKDDIGVSSTCLNSIKECVFSGFVIRFRFYQESHLPEYSKYHFQTHWKKVFIESKMNIVTRSSLSQQVLGQVPVLIPPMKEQIQIVEYLDSKTKEIDDLVQLEQKKIDLLKEYRQSLISEVVTGKVKVTQ